MRTWRKKALAFGLSATMVLSSVGAFADGFLAQLDVGEEIDELEIAEEIVDMDEVVEEVPIIDLGELESGDVIDFADLLEVGAAQTAQSDAGLFADDEVGVTYTTGSVAVINGVPYRVGADEFLGGGGDFENWNGWGTAERESLLGAGSASPTAAHTGSAGLLLDAGTIIWRHVCEVGARYVFSAWFKVPSGGSFDDGYRHINQGGTEVGRITIGTSAKPATGAWQQITCSFVAGDGDDALFRLYFRPTAGIMMDDVQLMRLEEYDGEFPVEIVNCYAETDNGDPIDYETGFTEPGKIWQIYQVQNMTGDTKTVMGITLLYRNNKLIDFASATRTVRPNALSSEIELEFDIPDDGHLNEYRYESFLVNYDAAGDYAMFGNLNTVNNPLYVYAAGYTGAKHQPSGLNAYIGNVSTTTFEAKIQGDSIVANGVTSVPNGSAVHGVYYLMPTGGAFRDVVAMKQVEIGTTFQHTLPFDDLVSSGVYDVQLHITGAERPSTVSQLVYVRADDANHALAVLNNPATTAADILALFDDQAAGAATVLLLAGYSSEQYGALTETQRQAFAAFLENNLGGEVQYAALQDLRYVMNAAALMAHLTDTSLSDEAIGEMILAQAPLYEGLPDGKAAAFSSLGEPDRAGVVRTIRANCATATTLAQLQQLIRGTSVLTVVEAAYYQNRVNLILEYADFFDGIPSSEITEVRQKYISEMTKEMRSKDLSSKEKIERAWETAYKAVLKDADRGSGSGGSGGSGGSSGGSGNKTSSGSVGTAGQYRGQTTKTITDYYNDMAGYEWASSAVLKLSEAGIVAGTGDKKFEPAGLLTREQFMKLLVNTVKGADVKATSSFTDVADTNQWYYLYVASAEKLGLTQGRGDGTFGIGDYVTFEDVVTLTYRAARMANAKLTPQQVPASVCRDLDAFSDYSLEALNALYGTKMITVDNNGKFYPKSNVTRAQASVVIAKLYELL